MTMVSGPNYRVPKQHSASQINKIFSTAFSVQHFQYSLFSTSFSVQHYLYSMFSTAFSIQHFPYSIFCTTFSVQHFSVQQFQYKVFTSFSVQHFMVVFSVATHESWRLYCAHTTAQSLFSIKQILHSPHAPERVHDARSGMPHSLLP